MCHRSQLYASYPFSIAPYVVMQDCAVAWDVVEELDAARSHAQDKKKANPAASDPLEQFCEGNPDADECRWVMVVLLECLLRGPGTVMVCPGASAARLCLLRDKAWAGQGWHGDWV